ncbi:MAG: aldo/keto reductase [Pseudomonadota bacterium]
MKFIDIKNAKMPALGFGTWQLTGNECYNAVVNAIDIGYRHIDTAQIYENEQQVGDAIRKYGIKREELFITTKLWTTNFTTEKVASSFEESLEKLQTDYIDLLLIHWHNPEVALSETLSAMAELVKKKKTKLIGVSNFPIKLMKEAIEDCKADIFCNQIEYHPMLVQNELLKYAAKNNVVITAYSPLARGRLKDNSILLDIGKKYSKTPAQIALRWLIEQNNVAAIPKAASAEHAKQNFDIFDFELSKTEHDLITNIDSKTRIINPSFAPEWDAA